jgi:MFS family permease
MALTLTPKSAAGSGLGREFELLWAGLSVSLLGSELTAIALPLLAALTLHASPLEMGAIAACGKAAYLVVGVPAGALADRVRRRPLIVVADVARAALLAGVVVLAATGSLSESLIARRARPAPPASPESLHAQTLLDARLASGAIDVDAAHATATATPSNRRVGVMAGSDMTAKPSDFCITI